MPEPLAQCDPVEQTGALIHSGKVSQWVVEDSNNGLQKPAAHKTANLCP